MAWRVGELVRNFLHAAVLAIACSIGFKVVAYHTDSSAFSLACFLVRLLLLQMVDVLLQRFESWEEDVSTCWVLRAAAALLRRLRRALALSPETSAMLERQRRTLQEVRRCRQTIHHQLAREDLLRLQNALPSPPPRLASPASFAAEVRPTGVAAVLASSMTSDAAESTSFARVGIIPARRAASGAVAEDLVFAPPKRQSFQVEEDGPLRSAVSEEEASTAFSVSSLSSPPSRVSASQRVRVWRWGSRCRRPGMTQQKAQILQLLAGFVSRRENKDEQQGLTSPRRRALVSLASRASARGAGTQLLPSRFLNSARNGGHRTPRSPP